MYELGQKMGEFNPYIWKTVMQMEPRLNMRTTYFKIAFAGLTMAIFVIIQYLTRMASFMYALCYIYPFLIFPLSLANLLV